MKNSYYLIFVGILALVMGLGENENELIPSELKLVFGISCIFYGVYINYYSKNKDITVDETIADTPNIKKNKKYRPSYIYLAIGVVTLKFSSSLITGNDYEMNIWIILIGILGFFISGYGLKMFFNEKRKKRESGSIE